MQQITLRAAAKLNMTLDITGVRPDGYHLLQMVMQTVSLYDTLTLRREERISPLRPPPQPGQSRLAGGRSLFCPYRR